MPDTLAPNVAELTQELIDATVMQMPQNAPLMNLVERIDIPDGHNAVEIPRANSTFSVQTPTEGDDLVNPAQFDLTSTTISPTLRAINVRISERARYFSREDVLKLISRELARAQGQDVDTDISAEFSNFGLTAGATNDDLTLAPLRTARRQLQANTVANGGPAPDPLYTVLAPIPVENLLTNLGVQGAVATNPWVPAGLSETFIREYLVPGVNLVGVPVFWDGYLTEVGALQRDLDILQVGTTDRLLVREDFVASQDDERIITSALEELVLLRGLELGAHFAGADAPRGVRTSVIEEALARADPPVRPVALDSIVAAIRSLITEPNDAESHILASLGRLAFGINVILQHVHSAVLRRGAFPKRVYLDATLVLPLIVNGHPLRSTYRASLTRLTNALRAQGQRLSIVVATEFLNEIVSHRRGSVELVRKARLTSRRRVGHHSLYFGQEGRMSS